MHGGPFRPTKPTGERRRVLMNITQRLRSGRIRLPISLQSDVW